LRRALIGLLTIKPQLRILFPFMLMASGRWRSLTFTVVALLAGIGLDAPGRRLGATGVVDPGFAACAWDLSPARPLQPIC
jgi:hypothetical protein